MLDVDNTVCWDCRCRFFDDRRENVASKRSNNINKTNKTKFEKKIDAAADGCINQTNSVNEFTTSPSELNN